MKNNSVKIYVYLPKKELIINYITKNCIIYVMPKYSIYTITKLAGWGDGKSKWIEIIKQQN